MKHLRLKTAVIVQARMTSSRFPGKSMAILKGKPVIQHVLERCKKIGANAVVLAVPDCNASLPLARVAEKMGCDCVPGSEHDVLGRYSKAAAMVFADVILRVTGDCPFFSPDIGKRVLQSCVDSGLRFDYVSNVWPKRTFPKGWDCEAFTWHALRRAHEGALEDYDREHVTPFMQVQDWARPGITQEKDESDINLCVDYPQDIARLESWHD